MDDLCLLSLDAASLICVASYLLAPGLLALGLASRPIGRGRGGESDDDAGMSIRPARQAHDPGGVEPAPLGPRELTMLRSGLCFGQLVGTDLVHGDGGGASVPAGRPAHPVRARPCAPNHAMGVGTALTASFVAGGQIPPTRRRA